MTNFKITDKISASKSVEIQVGQFYKDVSHNGYGIYLVVETPMKGYFLFNLSSGHSYLSRSSTLKGIFGDDYVDFELIQNLEIIIS